jgi:hypothetical protein
MFEQLTPEMLAEFGRQNRAADLFLLKQKMQREPEEPKSEMTADEIAHLIDQRVEAKVRALLAQYDAETTEDHNLLVDDINQDFDKVFSAIDNVNKKIDDTLVAFRAESNGHLSGMRGTVDELRRMMAEHRSHVQTAIDAASNVVPVRELKNIN